MNEDGLWCDSYHLHWIFLELAERKQALCSVVYIAFYQCTKLVHNI